MNQIHEHLFDENGLLVTSPRIIDNKHESIPREKVVFCDINTIQHDQKHKNREAMDYFLDQKLKQIKNDLLKSCLAEYWSWNPNMVLSNDLIRLPIDVVQMYGDRLVNYQNECLLDFAARQFTGYILDQERYHKYLRVKHVSGAAALMKLENRYNKSYCKKIKKRMDYLAAKYGQKTAVLLTLTLDPKKYGNDKLRMWREVKGDLQSFMKKLRIHFKRNGKTFPKYIHAIESQKNGNPHLHLVFLQATRLTDWTRILKYWGKGGIRINRTKDNQKVRYPVNYICKYITKTFANTNFDNIRTQSLVWLFGVRSFDKSKKLTAPLKPPSTGEWSADCLAIVSRMDNHLVEMDLINERLKLLYGVGELPPPYVVYSDGNEVYTTDSPFWASFFGG